MEGEDIDMAGRGMADEACGCIRLSTGRVCGVRSARDFWQVGLIESPLHREQHLFHSTFMPLRLGKNPPRQV